MRPCDTTQLAFRPFVASDVVLTVGEDRTVREVVLGGAGRFESFSTLTLFVPPGCAYLVGSSLTVNLLPAAHRHDVGIHFENGESVPSPRIAESRLAFECVVLATGTLDGEHAQNGIVVARILSTHQRWPRGCAIT